MIGMSEGQPLVASSFKYQWDPYGEEIIDEFVIDDEDNNDDDDENLLPPPPNTLMIDEDENEE